MTADTVQVKADGINATHIDETANYGFSGTFTLTTAPSGVNDVTNKAYVDGAVAGLHWIDPVDTFNLIDYTIDAEPVTKASGDAFIVGDGALTGAAAWTGLTAGDLVEYNGATYDVLLNVDTEVAASRPVRCLISAESSTVAQGSLATHDDKFIEFLTGTAATDYSSPTPTSPSDDDAVFCNREESNHFGHAVTYDLADTKWTEFAGPAALNAGNGLSYTGNTLNVNVDDSTIEINADTLRVKDLGVTTAKINTDAVTAAKINADVAGLGLGQAAGGELDVNVDDSSIEINADTLRVKALGITNAMLAGSITDAKLTDDYVKVSEVDEVTIDTAAGTVLRIKDLGVSNAKIANDTIQEPKLNSTNAPTDGYVLSYNAAGTNFTWIPGTADSVVESDFVKGTLAPAIGAETVMTSFSGSAAVLSNSVQVFLNGLIQEEGAGNDYTIVLSTGVVTFLTALDAGDIVQMQGVLDN